MKKIVKFEFSIYSTGTGYDLQNYEFLPNFFQPKKIGKIR